jgi:hypothetical protein
MGNPYHRLLHSLQLLLQRLGMFLRMPASHSLALEVTAHVVVLFGESTELVVEGLRAVTTSAGC